LITKGIFGAPLKSASLCGSTSDEYGLTVPDPVYRCFEEIMKRDFDKPPTYGKYLDLKSNDIHAITGVVKKFLRQLPDPAIPIASHEKFIQLYDESYSDQSTVTTLASMIQQLPREHFHLIYYIIILASKIQAHSDRNMMNPEALAVVLAPVCTGLEQNLKEIPSWKRHSRAKLINDMGHFIETNAKWTQIWTLLIEYSDTLLGIWRNSIIWDSVITPPGRNTVPCHPPIYSSTQEMIMLHPNRNHTQAASRLHQSELVLDVAPPKRPNPTSNKSSEELYKVVVLRSRQNTKSLKNTSKKYQFYANHDDDKKDDEIGLAPLPRHSNSTSSTQRHSMVIHSSISSITPNYFSKSSINLSSITAD
ncbi:Rho GTPase activation protein, partial [Gilbertella persicaria]|uniref:Rho GTPase activation protein n=1 Tax=Gilbertella persicaria TaxID=101096 RepID=UPI00221E3824